MKTRLDNSILFFLSFIGFVSKGYKTESFYKNIFNSEISKLESDFNFWQNEKEREEKYFLTKNLINSIITKGKPSNYSNKIVSLKNDGCVNFQEFNLNKKSLEEIFRYLDKKKIYLNHTVPFSKFATKSFKIAKFFSRYGSYNLEDILNCNELFNIITNKKLHSLISDYFECCATISNVNLYWTFPKFGDKLLRSRVSRYHRDLEDYKTAILFINLTDTTEFDGGHSYIKGSHKINFLYENLNNKKIDLLNINKNKNANNIDGYEISDELVNNELEHKLKIFHGPAGQAIITDNYGLHRAIAPQKPRLVFWLTFSLTQSSNMISLKRSNILPQSRVMYSNFSGKINKDLLNKNIFKNLINFEL